MPGRACSRWPTAWAATPAATSRRSTVIGALVDLDGEALGSARRADPCCNGSRPPTTELADIGSRPSPSLHGMGTTLIAILRAGNKLVLAHIGDSRAFLARDGEAHPDHQGPLVRPDASSTRAGSPRTRPIGHPQRSLVTRVLTGSDDDEPDVTVREARIGDRYLIASDGLTDYVARRHHRRGRLGRASPPGPPPTGSSTSPCKAGAPDNVTIVIGDVVDLTKVTAPPTQPQVVGAAATRTQGHPADPGRPRPPRPPRCRARPPAADDDDEDVTLAEEGPASGPGRWLRRLALLGLVALIVLGGGAYAAYAWSQRQYFVGAARGQRRHLPRASRRTSGPITLSHVEYESDVRGDDLPDFYRSQGRGHRVHRHARATPRPSSTSCAPRPLRCAVEPGHRRQPAHRCRRPASTVRPPTVHDAPPARPAPASTATPTTTHDDDGLELRPPHPPQRRAGAAPAGRRHRRARLRQRRPAVSGAFPPGPAHARRRAARHLPRLPPAAALEGGLRRPAAAADRHPAQRAGPGDDPPARHRQGHATSARAWPCKQLTWSALAVAIAAVVLWFLRDHRMLRRYTFTAAVVGFGLLILPAGPRHRPHRQRLAHLDRPGAVHLPAR